MVILGISGKRGVGKTALATYLSKYYNFNKVSFAYKLKEVARELFPFSDADLTDPKLKEKKWGGYDWSPREFMIHLGEFVRFHDTNYWLKTAISELTDEEGCYVFDDVRYKNEADALRSIGAKIIRINRHEKDNPYGKNLQTLSETDLDDYKFDYTVESVRNTSIRELYNHEEAILNLFEETEDDKS